MAYDEDLANLLREQLADVEGISEKALFGGLAFLLNGNMTVAASGQGGLMVRMDPDAADEALARPHASSFVMRGREMQGWIRVAPEGVRTARQIAPWVRRSLQFVRTLPPKG
jgi:TfoX/Sxy family transcriptional regulator of competence genes